MKYSDLSQEKSYALHYFIARCNIAVYGGLMDTVGKKEIEQLVALRERLVGESKDKYKESRRRGRLISEYGISDKDYDEMLKKQKGCCALCKRHHSNFKVRLSVDHNHYTDKVRGLLCGRCNINLVGHHTIGTALNVLDYLKKYGG